MEQKFIRKNKLLSEMAIEKITEIASGVQQWDAMLEHSN